MFQSVQELLNAKSRRRGSLGGDTESLLAGRIFDDRGNRMTPAAANKGALRYRYYVSGALTQGRKDQAGSLARVPAPDVERVVLSTLLKFPTRETTGQQTGCPQAGSEPQEATGAAALDEAANRADADADRQLIEMYLRKVVVSRGLLRISARAGEEAQPETIEIPWCAPAGRRRRDIIVPEGTEPRMQKPIRSETRACLVEAIAKARTWLDQLVSGKVQDTTEIAARDGTTERSVRMTLNLAFLSPALTRAAIDGTLPHGTGVSCFTSLPMDWRDQQHMIAALSRC